MLATPSQAPLLTRERVSPLYFFSYMFIPFSAIAFPHIGIFCLTAKRLSHFKHTAIAYPLCLMAIWLPSTILGVVANRATDVPAIERKLEARQMLATPGASLTPDERQALRRQADGEDVVIQLLHHYAPVWLAGLLGAGIMAAVMSSDSQILALSTMFTEDVFAHYDGKRRFGEAGAGEAGARVRDPGDAGGLRHRALGAGQHLLAGDAVRLLGLRGALADGVCRALLEAQHEVGRAGGHAVGGRRGRRDGGVPGRRAGAAAGPEPGRPGRRGLGPHLAHRHGHGGPGLRAGDADGPGLGGADVDRVDRHAPAVGGDHRALRRVDAPSANHRDTENTETSTENSLDLESKKALRASS